MSSSSPYHATPTTTIISRVNGVLLKMAQGAQVARRRLWAWRCSTGSIRYSSPTPTSLPSARTASSRSCSRLSLPGDHRHGTASACDDDRDSPVFARFMNFWQVSVLRLAVTACNSLGHTTCKLPFRARLSSHPANHGPTAQQARDATLRDKRGLRAGTELSSNWPSSLVACAALFDCLRPTS